MIKIKNKTIASIFILSITSIVIAGADKFERDKVIDPYRKTSSARIGDYPCLLYTSPSPRDVEESRMPSSA